MLQRVELGDRDRIRRVVRELAQRLHELVHLDRAGAVGIPRVEELVEHLARHVEAEHRHRLAEFLARDQAVGVVVPPAAGLKASANCAAS